MEEEQMLTKEQILDMLDAGQYSRNRSLWCSVSWQKKRLLRHLLI